MSPMTIGDALPDLGTPAEVAPILRKHPQTVERMCKRGALPAIKVGGRWLINLPQLRALLAAGGVS